MRAAVALALACAACGAAPRVRSPVDPSALRLSAGRTPVRVESPAAPQDVAVVPAGTEASQGMAVDPWCRTPCTLHLPPGDHAVWTGAPAVLDVVRRVRVGGRPVDVAVRAPSRARWERGRNVLVGGVGFAVVGGIFVAMSPLEVAGGSPTGPETIAVGVGLGALGAALIAHGLASMRAESRGADAVREGPP